MVKAAAAARTALRGPGKIEYGMVPPGEVMATSAP
jgi:hypothetical protein